MLLGADGLSPRVRGHRDDLAADRSSIGSIPACAGSPQAAPAIPPEARVYPRVCGVTNVTASVRPLKVGLSPRVRGHPAGGAAGLPDEGSIPACAGSPPGLPGSGVGLAVYPRVCGVTWRLITRSMSAGGLSPRVRGHLDIASVVACKRGSIPACAGSPPQRTPAPSMLEVYPRVCGVTRRSPGAGRAPGGLSPRVRGHLWMYLLH